MQEFPGVQRKVLYKMLGGKNLDRELFGVPKDGVGDESEKQEEVKETSHGEKGGEKRRRRPPRPSNIEALKMIFGPSCCDDYVVLNDAIIATERGVSSDTPSESEETHWWQPFIS